MIKWIKKLFVKEDKQLELANKLSTWTNRDRNKPPRKPGHVHTTDAPMKGAKVIAELDNNTVFLDGRTYSFDNKLWSKHLTGTNTGDETVPLQAQLEYRGIYELMSGEYPSERGIEAGFTWTIKITNEHFRLQVNRVYDGYYLIAKVNNPGQIKENWTIIHGVHQ